QLTHGEDLNMWERLARSSKLAVSPEILSYYVVDSENRAMGRLPPLKRTSVYYTNFTTIDNPIEKSYYQYMIAKSVKKSLLGLKPIRALRLYCKYRSFFPLITLLRFLKSR